MSILNILEWMPTIVWCTVAIGLFALAARIIKLEWIPRCPVCNGRGYREVCAVSSMQGIDALTATDAEMNWREIRRCNHCRIYRMNGPRGWLDLPWDNWQREASRLMQDDMR